MIILIGGKRGSGKTTIAKDIVKSVNAYHIEMSESLKSLRSYLGCDSMRLRVFVDYSIGKYGYKYLIDNTIRDIKKEDIVIITGIKHDVQAKYIKEKYSDHVVLLYYLDIYIIIRLYRTIKRNQRTSLIEFIIEEYYDIKWSINNMKKISILLKGKRSDLSSYIVNMIDDLGEIR